MQCNIQKLIRMKNNFIPSFNNSRKQQDNMQKSALPLSPKSYLTSCNHIDKRAYTFPEVSPHYIEEPSNSKGLLTTEEDSISQEQSSSCQGSQVSSKISGNRLFFPKRHGSPIKNQSVSPLGYKSGVSPNFKQGRVLSNHFIPIRSTLKNLIQNKAAPDHDNSFKNDQFCNTWTTPNKDTSLNSSCKINRTLNEMSSPMKSIQKQNKILRQQNSMLRNELNEIKKKLLFGVASKKEQIISNLRDTIKKEDSQIKQLRLKLDIVSKKNVALSNLLQSKEEENVFMTSKLAKLDAELRDYKEKNGEKLEKFKEKINFILKSYNQLEFKAGKQEIEWLIFKQKWFQQKSLYLDRIKFLQEYIAQSS